MVFFLQMILTGIMVGSIYSLLALGFVLVYKSSKVFNFAQGEFLMFGAYFGWMCLVPFHLPVWMTFVLIVVFTYVLGLIVDRLLMRQMIGQPVLSAIMMTIALSYMLTGFVVGVWGGGTETYPHIFQEVPLKLGPLALPQEYVYLFFMAILMVVGLVLFFNYTKTGLSMMATAENHKVSQSMGINVKKAFAVSWAIAAMTAGAGGAFLASINGVNPGFSMFGFKVFPVVILGGLESIPGAIIGGLIIGLLEYLSIGFVDPLIEGFSSILPYLVLLGILMIKPYGLFGLVRIERI